MEDEEVEDRNGDVTVRKVEDGREEQLATHQRHPLGEVEEGEVEHIDHLAIDEWGIAATLGQELCNTCEGRFGEDYTIECAIDHIADGSRKNHRKANNYTSGRFATP